VDTKVAADRSSFGRVPHRDSENLWEESALSAEIWELLLILLVVHAKLSLRRALVEKDRKRSARGRKENQFKYINFGHM